jgi:hypothetical protein
MASTTKLGGALSFAAVIGATAPGGSIGPPSTADHGSEVNGVAY